MARRDWKCLQMVKIGCVMICKLWTLWNPRTRVLFCPRRSWTTSRNLQIENTAQVAFLGVDGLEHEALNEYSKLTCSCIWWTNWNPGSPKKPTFTEAIKRYPHYAQSLRSVSWIPPIMVDIALSSIWWENSSKAWTRYLPDICISALEG